MEDRIKGQDAVDTPRDPQERGSRDDLSQFREENEQTERITGFDPDDEDLREDLVDEDDERMSER